MKRIFLLGALATGWGSFAAGAAESATNFVPQNPPAMQPLTGRDKVRS